MSVLFKSDKSSDDKGIASVYWQFGDGTESSELNPRHEYSTTGTYTASLTVTDSDGNSDTQTVDLTVIESQGSGTPPTASISVPASRGKIPFNVQLDGSGSLGQNNIVNYEWDGSYTHLRAHETVLELVWRRLLEKKKKDVSIINTVVNG